MTYYGDLEDETDKPVATKIVTEDAMDSEDAKINTLSGKVAEVGADYVVIDTADRRIPCLPSWEKKACLTN